MKCDIRSAVISSCRRYRYCLVRRWGAGDRVLVFLMLNPSTADADRDDPTVRRCVGFAKQSGFECLKIINLFGLRSTDPKALKSNRDSVGSDNDFWVERIAGDPYADVIVSWGAHGALYTDRVRHVCGLVQRPMQCLSLLKSGHPGHPLMLPYGLVPRPWKLEYI